MYAEKESFLYSLFHCVKYLQRDFTFEGECN